MQTIRHRESQPATICAICVRGPAALGVPTQPWDDAVTEGERVMAKRRSISQKELDSAWKGLPESDRRFFTALIVLMETIGDKELRYSEPPAPLQRTLCKLDHDALFSVIAECLYLLLDAPIFERVKQGHRERAARKKKRASAAKKRSSTVKKKPRAKQPAPKRRTTRKGPSQ